MEPDASPPPDNLTEAEWAEFRALLDAAPTLPCGGRSWEHGFNGDSPIFRPASNRDAKHSVRRLMWAAQHDGKMPSRRVYTLHWGCIDHLTSTRSKAATKPEPPAEQLALDVDTGYRRVWAPEHPLATRAGLVLEHRRVLYEALDGRHAPCHWCGRDLSWDAVQGDDDELTVDHLDWDRDHNDPANLVPACRPCNAARTEKRSGRAGRELLDGTGTGSRAIASDSGADQGRPVAPVPTSPPTPEGQEDGTDGLVGTGGSLWRRVRRNRWARAAAVAVAVAVASWVAVTSPASFLPGVDIGRRGGQEPPVTSPAPVVPGEAPVASTPPSSERTTTTPWTLPEPCTPAHCPSLDD